MMKLNQEAVRTTEEIASEFGRLVEDGRALLAEAADRAPGKVRRIQDALAGVGEHLADIQTSATRAARRGARYAHRADDYVHDYPWPVVAGGVILGVLAALWFAQRR